MVLYPNCFAINLVVRGLEEVTTSSAAQTNGKISPGIISKDVGSLFSQF